MLSKNIKFNSKQILEFYSRNRQKWEEFYPSEKWVFEKISKDNKIFGDVLDVGCACGGLGFALSSRFTLNSYTGVDIHRDAINWTKREQRLSMMAHFIHGDILKLNLDKQYDKVVSLSCADFNIETNKIIKKCWSLVKPGGYLVASLRLTDKKGINNIQRSFQYINFSGKEKNPEICNYVVFNFSDSLVLFAGLTPSPQIIGAYGYWGKPSPTARTPFKKLVFAVYYIKKSRRGFNSKSLPLEIELNLPFDFLSKAILKINR
jgi:SAM-dependent methyltransferase